MVMARRRTERLRPVVPGAVLPKHAEQRDCADVQAM